MSTAATDSPPNSLLTGALQALRHQQVTGLPALALAQDLVELRSLLDSLEAEFNRRVAAFDRSRAFAALDLPSTATFLRSSCRLAPGAASEQVRLARSLPLLPATQQAFGQGQISREHASVIAHSAEEVGTAAVQQAEPELLQAARSLHPQHLRRVTRHLRYYLDPDGALVQDECQHRRRYLHLSQTLEGVFYLDGRLDAEGGAILRTALLAVSGPPGADDQRSASERRADDLVELGRRQLDQGQLRSSGGQRPHLSLIADLATLQQQPGCPAADLDWGTPVHPQTARRLACDASLTPIVVDERGDPLALGRTRRVVSPALRRALVARDRTCRWPGCDRPACWTSAHHLRHWADGGPTDKANTVLVCAVHHRRCHEGGYRMVMDDSGRITVIPPASRRSRDGPAP